MSFGEETRTATSDANAGVVNVPSVRDTARAQGIRAIQGEQHAVNPTTTGLAKLSSGIAEKIQQRIEKKQQEEHDARVLSAAQDQGEDTAINDIALAEKRGGIAEFIFGQSATYEGAQRRAVENNITQWANEEAYGMEQNAGMSRQEYSDYLESAYKEKAKNFEGDPESLTMLQEQYSKASSKLMEKYTKERYVYIQTQNYETMQSKVAGLTDSLVQETNDISSPEEGARTVGKWARLYDYDMFMEDNPSDTSITKANFDKILTSNLIGSLTEGNAQAYLAAKESGFIERQPRTTQAAIEAAHQKWVQHSDMKAADARIAISREALTVKSEEDIEHLKQSWYSNQEVYPEKFNATEYQRFITSAYNTLAKKENNSKKAADTYQDLTNARDKLITHSNHGPVKLLNKASRDIVYSNVLRDRLDGVMGAIDEEIDPKEQLQTLKTDATAATNAATFLKDINDITPTEELFFETGAQSLFSGKMVYPKGHPKEGFPNEEALMLMNNMDIYEQRHKGILASVLDEETMFKYRYMQWGLDHNMPMEDIKAGWAKDRTDGAEMHYTVEGKHGKQIKASRNAYLSEDYDKLLDGRHRSADGYLKYVQSFEDGLRVTGDQKQAEFMAAEIFHGRNIQTNGKDFLNGKALDTHLRKVVKHAKPIPVKYLDVATQQLVADDPSITDGSIPIAPIKIPELLQFMQENTNSNDTWWKAMMIKANPNTGRFDNTALQQSDISMEVPHGANFVEFTSIGTGAARITRMPFQVFERAQQEYSVQVYKDNRRAEIQRIIQQRINNREGVGLEGSHIYSSGSLRNKRE